MSSETTEEKLLTVLEAAEVLGVSKSWVYQAVARGHLPAFKVGRKLKFARAKLAAWLQSQETKAPVVATLGRG